MLYSVWATLPTTYSVLVDFYTNVNAAILLADRLVYYQLLV